MKLATLPAAVGLTLILAPVADAFDLGKLTQGAGVGKQMMQAATLSDADVKAVADQACAQYDAEAKISPASSKYGKRLAEISKKMGSDINGQPVNYKVYVDPEVNAWAMANGCIRVNTGLMDMMTDDEVIGVLGHEMGHVALGHTKKAMQMAYTTAAARNALGTFGSSGVQQLSKSEIGSLGEAFLNAQFSQSQESEADNFSYELLGKKGLNRKALLSAFQKLASLGDQHSMLSTHPASSDRAKNVETKLAKDGVQ